MMRRNGLKFHLLLLCAVIAFYGAAGASNNAVEEASNLVKEKRFEQAIVKFEDAISQDPNNPTLYLSLGLAYQASKRYPEAIRSIERAADLSPNSPEPFYSLALLYEAVAVNPKLLMGPNAPETKIEKEAHHKHFLLKAKEAWGKVMQLDRDAGKMKTAQAHLEKISDLLK